MVGMNRRGVFNLKPRIVPNKEVERIEEVKENEVKHEIGMEIPVKKEEIVEETIEEPIKEIEEVEEAIEEVEIVEEVIEEPIKEVEEENVETEVENKRYYNGIEITDELLEEGVIDTTNNVIYANAQIADDETNANKAGIIKCCKGEQKTSGKLTWAYLKDFLENIEI